MALSLEQLREEALALPADQRLNLADSIYESLDETSFELHPSWIPELQRRYDDFASGKTQGIPWEVIQERMKARRT